MKLIQRDWPLAIRLLLAPIAMIGLVATFPLMLLLVGAGEEDLGFKLLGFWIPFDRE